MIARLNPKVSKRHQLCAAGRSQLGAVVVVVALGFIMSGCVNCIPDISVASSASNCTVIEHNGTQREKCIFCNKVLKSSHCKFPSLHPKMFHFLNQKLIYMPDCSFRDQGNWSDPFPYEKIQFNFFLVIRYWQGRHRPIILWKIYQHPPQSRCVWWQTHRATSCALPSPPLTNHRLFLSEAGAEHSRSQHIPFILFLNSHQAPRAIVRSGKDSGRAICRQMG